MEMCDGCKRTVGAGRNVGPHAALRETSRKKWTGGWAKGVVVHYTCTDCDTKWIHDNDKKDDGAGWEQDVPFKIP